MIEANNVNLNLMKTFIVVAESKSLADAGEKLGYASSSISTSISTLENQLGVKLFTRKPLKLTEIGKEIYDNAKLGMRTVDFAVTIAQSKNDMNCAKISIGCPSHITEFYLMERIENAINDYPDMCVSIDTESDSRELIEEIRQNKIDFAILDSVPSDCKEELVIKELKKREVEVTLTTNGSLFTKKDLDCLKEIGIDGINFSIDTLDLREYFLLTQQDCLETVLDNLFYAYQLKIPVKINCVMDDTFHLKRLNDLMDLIKDKKIAVRFIELMPLNREQRNQKIRDVIKYLKKYPIQEYLDKLGNGPAHYYTIEGYAGYIGFIEALHYKFCHQCNRLRLTSTGKIKPCLFYEEMYDLKPYLNNEKQLRLHLEKAIKLKPKEHHFEENISYTRMNEIGG